VYASVSYAAPSHPPCVRARARVPSRLSDALCERCSQSHSVRGVFCRRKPTTDALCVYTGLFEPPHHTVNAGL